VPAVNRLQRFRDVFRHHHQLRRCHPHVGICPVVMVMRVVSTVFICMKMRDCLSAINAFARVAHHQLRKI
jgi:hypothetical protein